MIFLGIWFILSGVLIATTLIETEVAYWVRLEYKFIKTILDQTSKNTTINSQEIENGPWSSLHPTEKKIIKRINDTLTSGYKGANADERSNWLIEIMGQLLYFQFAYLKVVIVILSP